MLAGTRTAEDTRRAPTERSSSWSFSHARSWFRQQRRAFYTNRSDFPGRTRFPPKSPLDAKAIENIVLLLAFRLILLYYSALHEWFIPKRLSLSREKYGAISIFLGGIATFGLRIPQPGPGMQSWTGSKRIEIQT